jgi:hypothetical protein
MRTLILFLIASTTFGQTIIKGRVIDTMDNQPMIGCLLASGLKNLGTTDNVGRFEITVDSTIKEIEVRFIGYSSLRIRPITSLNLGDIFLFSEFFIFDPPKKGNFTYTTSDSIIVKGTYRRHKLNGHFTALKENRKIKIEGTYRNGKKSGPWTYYRPDGQKIQYNFKDDLTVLN